MIPKIMHYCWFGNNPLPKDVKKCINSWRKYCPDYEIIEWNESNFDVNCHPFVKAAYEAGAWAFVSDYARLKVVYDNGGIYFDTDVELLKNIDFLLDYKCYVGLQQEVLLCATGLGFGAEKGSLAVKKMLEEYDNIDFNQSQRQEIACPYLNHNAVEKLGYKEFKDEITDLENVTVFPPRYFDPLAPGKTQNLLCEDTISIHHYSASWTSKSNQLKRKIFRIIGEENIFYIKKILKK